LIHFYKREECRMNDPYLPFSIEEISQVTSVEHWSNRRVRVVGRLTAYDPGTSRGRLAGEGEGISSSVRVSFFFLLEGNPNHPKANLLTTGSLIQVLGEVDLFKNEPMVSAHIIKDMLGLDTSAYHRALDRIQSFLPLNIKTTL